MSYLPKKLKKYYSARIAEKLEKMGVKDEIMLVPSGKKQRMFKPDDKGQISFKDGVPETVEVDVPTARNRFRSAIKRLREQPEEVILSFLNMEAPVQPEPQSEVPVIKVSSPAELAEVFAKNEAPSEAPTEPVAVQADQADSTEQAVTPTEG